MQYGLFWSSSQAAVCIRRKDLQFPLRVSPCKVPWPSAGSHTRAMQRSGFTNQTWAAASWSGGLCGSGSRWAGLNPSRDKWFFDETERDFAEYNTLSSMTFQIVLLRGVHTNSDLKRPEVSWWFEVTQMKQIQLCTWLSLCILNFKKKFECLMFRKTLINNKIMHLVYKFNNIFIFIIYYYYFFFIILLYINNILNIATFIHLIIIKFNTIK